MTRNDHSEPAGLSRRAALKLGIAGIACPTMDVLGETNQQTGGYVHSPMPRLPAPYNCPKPGDDGLCGPSATAIRAHQLLGVVCVLGGAKCPLIEAAKAGEILAMLKINPAAAIRLESNADQIPHYTALSPDIGGALAKGEVLNRKRDLDVLQRLGLAPGDTRRARYLFELLFDRIATPAGICAYDTPGWEGCQMAKTGAYEKVRVRGWSAVVYCRSQQEREEYRKRNVERINTGERLFIRPHHLICLSCYYAGGNNQAPRPDDTLIEIWRRIRRQPDVPITLVEGQCAACDCCDGFHPPTGRCVHAGGLIRDYKKDLDVFQKLGLMPGATMPARKLFALLFERIGSTREICGYGDGVVRSEEWKICGEPGGNPGYAATRQTGIFAGEVRNE